MDQTIYINLTSPRQTRKKPKKKQTQKTKPKPVCVFRPIRSLLKRPKKILLGATRLRLRGDKKTARQSHRPLFMKYVTLTSRSDEKKSFQSCIPQPESGTRPFPQSMSFCRFSQQNFIQEYTIFSKNLVSGRSN